MDLSNMFASCPGRSMCSSAGQDWFLGLNSNSACLVRLWSVLGLKAVLGALTAKVIYFEFFIF